MKKIFLNLSVIAVMGLTFTACSNEEANKKAKEADDAAVAAMVQEKLANIDAEVMAECDAKVLAAAQPKADSLVAAAKASGKKVVVPVVKKPIVKAPTPKAPTKPTGPQPGQLGGGKEGTTTATNNAAIGEGKQGTTQATGSATLGKGKQGLAKP